MTSMPEMDRYIASLTEDGRYRLLVDSITDYAIYMLDPWGFVTSWNEGARRFKGYQESEIIGKHFSIFYDEADRLIDVPTLALFLAAQKGGFETEGWRLRKDGSRFWAHVSIKPIHDASRKLVGFSKVTKDLTSQQSALTALRNSQNQFKLLVQGVTDCAIYMLDLEGKVISWNSGAERIKGYTEQEILGRHFSQFYTEEDQAKCEPDRALAVAAKEGRYEKEGWRVRRDGSRFWAQVVINPIMDANQQVTGFGKVTRDISAQRAAQLALERARETILQSEKATVAGQLAGRAVHDLNDALTVVMNSLEGAINCLPAQPGVTALLISARQAAWQGALVTQRLLAFGLRQELKPETVALQPLIYGMIDVLQDTFGPDVAIEIDFPTAPKMAFVDAGQLKLAILNLAINSNEAMRDGGRVKISARQRNSYLEESGEPGMQRMVCLSFADSGTGMDQATLAQATEPFFSTKEPGRGSGLGLTMVKRFVEQSGGMFVLHSRGKGRGTTAEIWLPEADSVVLDSSPAEQIELQLE